jgi:hypothetical protein
VNDRPPTYRRTFSLLFALAAAGCTEEAKAPPSDLLLSIDGLEIRRAEVEPLVKFFDSIGPEWATRVKYRRALDEFVIPLRLAQRAFPAERAKLLERAQHLRSVATNVIELEKQGAQQVLKRQDLTRRSVEIPVATFLFDPMTTGGVSDPIEVPRGWILAGAYEIKEAALVLDDLADAVQVGFLTHTPGDWATWLDLEKHRLADKLTYVHPDFREHLPEWIKLP